MRGGGAGGDGEDAEAAAALGALEDVHVAMRGEVLCALGAGFRVAHVVEIAVVALVRGATVLVSSAARVACARRASATTSAARMRREADQRWLELPMRDLAVLARSIREARA